MHVIIDLRGEVSISHFSPPHRSCHDEKALIPSPSSPPPSTAFGSSFRVTCVVARVAVNGVGSTGSTRRGRSSGSPIRAGCAFGPSSTTTATSPLRRPRPMCAKVSSCTSAAPTPRRFSANSSPCASATTLARAERIKRREKRTSLELALWRRLNSCSRQPHHININADEVKGLSAFFQVKAHSLETVYREARADDGDLRSPLLYTYQAGIEQHKVGCAVVQIRVGPREAPGVAVGED